MATKNVFLRITFDFFFFHVRIEDGINYYPFEGFVQSVESRSLLYSQNFIINYL